MSSFKPFVHIARQGLPKTLAHGYAQSFVAASQSSYATSSSPFAPFNSHRFNRSGSVSFRGVFQQNSLYSSSSTKQATGGEIEHTSSSQGALDEYFAAWQKHQQQPSEDGEWQQFQFAKRIGWKTTASGADIQAIGEENGTRPEARLARTSLGKERPSTSSTGDAPKSGNSITATAGSRAQEAAANEDIDTSAPADATIRPTTAQNLPVPQEPTWMNIAAEDTTATKDAPQILDLSSADSALVEAEDTHTSISEPATFSPAPVSRSSETTVSESREDIAISSQVDQIITLQSRGQFAEIPPIFEGLLKSGATPPAPAYNALLVAAVHLPALKHQVVPKVLDVYSDMLRRKVTPNTDTYSLLLDILSSRALQVVQGKATLEQDRARFGGMSEVGRFMFRSHEAEHDLLVEDNALNVAMKLFHQSIANQQRIYSAETYRLLLKACAAMGEVDHMIQVYSHMESNKVSPFASAYPAMINAFAKSGDLRSAVECYNEYKALATAHDRGEASLVDRADDEVYAAVIRSYAACDKPAGAEKFYGKIVASFVESESHEQLDKIRDSVELQAFIPEHIATGNFTEALSRAQNAIKDPRRREQALNDIVISAADCNDSRTATMVFEQLSDVTDSIVPAAIALLAMHIRNGNVESARTVWTSMSSLPKPSLAFVEPTAMYAASLIGSGSIDEGLMEARQTFASLRSSAAVSGKRSEISEHIDEGIEFIGSFLAEKAVRPSPHASMNFMWAMVENGGLILPVAEHLLAGLGPADIATLSWQDLKLALQVEAGIVGRGSAALDVAHTARLAHLLETVLVNQVPLDTRSAELVELSLGKMGYARPDLVAKWHTSKNPLPKVVPHHAAFAPTPAPANFNDNFDPYASTVDHRGSAIIVDELEKQGFRGASPLNEALLRFKNIRRAGRHPRYIAYAKLITAAAKDGRSSLVHDLFGMAEQDLPLLARYPVVKHGWTSILDAMLGACLTLGNRSLAGKYHQKLLDLGTTPSANTYGLYITTLKESTKTFDEASEAVKVFQRATSEGVEPSSFLYNALIGKLGKARRIDDCLFYFTEMRARGIRPTSVTYGTIVNALCRVSDERFAQELFDEMESMPNYKPRPAPYNSLMQFFLTTKRDSGKVIEYYHRMQARNIQPTMHTFKLMIDTYATLEPVDMAAAEGVLETIRASGQRPEAVHYASLIHAKGCVLHDMTGARKIFDEVLTRGLRPQASLYQALFESMVANHCVEETDVLLAQMAARGVEMTAYIANTLIHGWAMAKDIAKAADIFASLGKDKREPSTYEAMTRAFLSADRREQASDVVHEMLSRGYPTAVSGKILELLGHGAARTTSSTTVIASESAAASL